MSSRHLMITLSEKFFVGFSTLAGIMRLPPEELAALLVEAAVESPDLLEEVNARRAAADLPRLLCEAITASVRR